jgi:uncharacterized YccA/Bax inhibitor family protein
MADPAARGRRERARAAPPAQGRRLFPVQTMNRSSNPALSDAAMTRAAQDLQPGWGAPSGGPPGLTAEPGETMTMGGVATATAVLIALVGVGAFFGWQQVEQVTYTNAFGDTVVETQIPGWTWLALFGALGVAIVTILKPGLARITAPLYALIEGVVLGAISAVYNAQFEGIVLQAVLCTMGVFLAMLFLYGTRIIRVTRKLIIGVIAATFGVFVVYLATALWSLFTDTTPAIYDAGAIGIGFSLLVVAIAAFNLLLDFDFIERGTEAGLPKGMEWYAAFGLVVTLVWLYIEILRLLSKLRQ